MALLRYDAAHDAELLHTLSTFIRCRYNATIAARELYVARSTLLHRLERIEELARIDFDNQADMTYLSLSLAMISRLYEFRRYCAETGNSKYVSGYGSSARVKCHHSQKMGSKPLRSMASRRNMRLTYCSSVIAR